ncbi:hypothetical protein DNTS_022314, partial [Danionella cerebrum]
GKRRGKKCGADGDMPEFEQEEADTWRTAILIVSVHSCSPAKQSLSSPGLCSAKSPLSKSLIICTTGSASVLDLVLHHLFVVTDFDACPGSSGVAAPLAHHTLCSLLGAVLQRIPGVFSVGSSSSASCNHLFEGWSLLECLLPASSLVYQGSIRYVKRNDMNSTAVLKGIDFHAHYKKGHDTAKRKVLIESVCELTAGKIRCSRPSWPYLELELHIRALSSAGAPLGLHLCSLMLAFHSFQDATSPHRFRLEEPNRGVGEQFQTGQKKEPEFMFISLVSMKKRPKVRSTGRGGVEDQTGIPAGIAAS